MWCVCVRVHVHMRVCVCGGKRRSSAVSLQPLLALFSAHAHSAAVCTLRDLRAGACTLIRVSDALRCAPPPSPHSTQVVAGQGTIGLEMLLALMPAQLGAVLVPVGGGGLVGGIAAMLKAVDASIRVRGRRPGGVCMTLHSFTCITSIFVSFMCCCGELVTL